jgi:hypothetical protein
MEQQQIKDVGDDEKGTQKESLAQPSTVSAHM